MQRDPLLSDQLTFRPAETRKIDGRSEFLKPTDGLARKQPLTTECDGACVPQALKWRRFRRLTAADHLSAAKRLRDAEIRDKEKLGRETLHSQTTQ